MHVPQYAPNPNDTHKSVSITGTATKLAQLGVVFDRLSSKFYMQANGAPIRYTVNTNAPATTTGILLNDGDVAELDSIEAASAQFIAVSGSPKLEIASYYKL
jgi:hypothetical protein